MDWFKILKKFNVPCTALSQVCVCVRDCVRAYMCVYVFPDDIFWSKWLVLDIC